MEKVQRYFMILEDLDSMFCKVSVTVDLCMGHLVIRQLTQQDPPWCSRRNPGSKTLAIRYSRSSCSTWTITVLPFWLSIGVKLKTRIRIFFNLMIICYVPQISVLSWPGPQIYTYTNTRDRNMHNQGYRSYDTSNVQWVFLVFW